MYWAMLENKNYNSVPLLHPPPQASPVPLLHPPPRASPVPLLPPPPKAPPVPLLRRQGMFFFWAC